MKRILILLPLLLTLALSFTGSTAHATSRIPTANLSCTPSFCVAYNHWTGLSVHGFRSVFTVDNPGGNTTGYDKYIEADINGSNAWVDVGISKGVNGACGSSSVEYYYQSAGHAASCYSVNVNDINKVVDFAISYYTSNGGGAFAWIHGTPAGDDPCTPCSIPGSVYTNPYNNAQMFLEYETNSSGFTGHAVWGGSWQGQQWFDGTNWNYVTTNGNQVVNPPPQLFWHTSPQIGGSQGGTLYSCVYDSTTNACTPGS